MDKTKMLQFIETFTETAIKESACCRISVTQNRFVFYAGNVSGEIVVSFFNGIFSIVYDDDDIFDTDSVAFVNSAILNELTKRGV